MAARGAAAKEYIKNKILEMFDEAFTYSNGKELRIPFNEGGSEVQIKVTLTAAKDNVSPDGGGVVETSQSAAVPQETGNFMNFPEPKKPVEPSQQEKENVETLLKSLGLA